MDIFETVYFVSIVLGNLLLVSHSSRQICLGD